MSNVQVVLALLASVSGLAPWTPRLFEAWVQHRRNERGHEERDRVLTMMEGAVADQSAEAKVSALARLLSMSLLLDRPVEPSAIADREYQEDDPAA